MFFIFFKKMDVILIHKQKQLPILRFTRTSFKELRAQTTFMGFGSSQWTAV